MTPLRQALNAALLTAGLCVTVPVWAEPVAPMGPPTEADAAAEAAAAKILAAPPPPAPAPVAKPAASAKAPSWLANRPASKAPVAGGKSALPSLGRMLGLFLVLGSLGGAAVYFKRRGRPDVKNIKPKQRLTVLSSTRIGPKAHAVVISVAGRQMLLGVTDSNVQDLGFIDEIAEEEDERELGRGPSRDPVRRAADQARERGAGIAVRTVTPEPQPKAGSFADVLKTAFGRRAAAPTKEADAASILAAETQDTVGGKPVASNPASVRMLDVEGQAQGLIRRLGGGPKA